MHALVHKASRIQEPELRWLVERGGKLFVFGKFGETQYFRYGITFDISISSCRCSKCGKSSFRSR